MSNAWDEIRRKVALVIPGFKRCRIHDLRHTAGSDLVRSGASIAEVKEILGHQEISTTMRYAHVRQEQLQTAVARVPIFHRISTSEAEEERRTAD